MKSRRIELNAEQAGLNAAAFAGLSLPDLPPGPALAETLAPQTPVVPRGRVVLRRETAHRSGKAVLIIDDFAAHLTPEEIDALARRLRNACGCGGTVRGRAIELQGEPVAKVRSLLEEEGYTVAGVR